MDVYRLNLTLFIRFANPHNDEIFFFCLPLAQTGISAKAQRKIAREIKTARAFGLMPFTTMGTKAFTFGKTMENRDQDFEYEVVDDDDEYDNPAE